MSSVPTPGPVHSLLSAGCNERKALPVFAGKRAGERANFMRCYSVKGAAPTTSLILFSHPMRRGLSAPFYSGENDPQEDSGHLSKLTRLKEGKLGVRACLTPHAQQFSALCDVCGNPGPPQLPGEEQLDRELS